MSKAPRRPSQRDDLRRWDDEGGAPHSGHPSHEPHLAPKHEVEPALYYFNIRSDHARKEDLEGTTLPDLKAALEEALARARHSLTRGDRKGEDRRGWRVEIMDGTRQHLLTVAFTETYLCEWPRRSRGRIE